MYSNSSALASPPSDWEKRVAEGQILYSDSEPTNIELMPSGVFNGEATAGPSHRGVIPSPLSYSIEGATVYAAGLDMERAVYLRRVSVPSSKAKIEQRWYAHRTLRSLLVHEIHVDNSEGNSAVSLNLALNTRTSTDILFNTIENTTTFTQITGKIQIPEIPNGYRTEIGAVFSTKPQFISVEKNAKNVFYFFAAFRSNLDSSNPAEDALKDYVHAVANQDTLFSSHVKEWAEIWNSRIEIAGDTKLALAVNSSLYYILSSIRDDWPWSLSPGSLSSNSYNGHTFWDTETWMYPPILFLYPKIARDGILQYRINTKDGAATKAKSYNKGYKGYMFAWESAFTGQETCPVDAPTGELEHHITGDIAFAFQQYFYATRDLKWLVELGWPVIKGIAEFWESRVSLNSNTNQYEINGVIPPDEYAVNINNSVYTNAVAALSLNFACEVSKIIGTPCSLNWQKISANLKIAEDQEKDIHLEFDGYKGELIKQADVILLSYPLMYPMSDQRKKNNLEYYAPRTDKAGPAMTYSMETIGWLDLNLMDKATEVWPNAYANAQLPFFVWYENSHPPGGAVNFITGAGGFLQGIISGFGGLRLYSDKMTFNPKMLAPVTTVKFHRIHYLQNEISFYLNTSSSTVTVTAAEPRAPRLSLKENATGKTHDLKVGNPVTVSAGSFSVQAKN